MTGRSLAPSGPAGLGAAAVAPDNREKTVFYSVAAQEDNLGDVVIRRIVLHWIADQCNDVHIFSGGMSDSYLSALSLTSGVTVHQSPRSFAKAWLRGCSRRRVALVFAPGPRVAVPTLASARAAAVMAGMAAVTRIAGGPVTTAGGSISGRRSPAMLLHRLTASLSSDYSVRDEVSRDWLRQRPRRIPDVAFANADPAGTLPADPVLVISLRSDRQTDTSALEKLVDGAISARITPVIVTQVRRDQANHQQLAQVLGVELCGWTDQSHAEQLDRIEAVYRRSVVVYTNRLHAGIFGARHGAEVITPDSTGTGKVLTAFRSVYPCLSEVPQDLSALLSPSPQAFSQRADRAERVKQAAHSLDEEHVTLADYLRGAHHATAAARAR